MAWSLSQRRGRQGQDKAVAAAEVLRSLFAPERRQPQTKKEYTCKGCGCSNYTDRVECRRCKLGKGKPKPQERKQVTLKPSQKLTGSPEERTGAAEAKAAACERAAALLREAGCEQEAEQLKQPAVAWTRAATVRQRPGARMDASEAFVQRAEKRLVAATAAVAEADAAAARAREKQARLRLELQQGQQRLEELRLEVKQSAPAASEAANAATDERTALLRMVQALEKTSFAVLPAEVRSAMEAAHVSLGTDNAPIQFDHGTVNEQNIPAGRLDGALTDAPMPGAVVAPEGLLWVPPPPEEDSDETLLQWAKTEQRKSASIGYRPY